MTFEKTFHSRLQYRSSLLIVLLLLIAGVLMEWFIGHIPEALFTFPGNVWLGVAFIAIFTTVFFTSRHTAIMQLLASVPFAITTTIVLGILTIGLGSIQLKDEHTSGFLGKLGLDNITTTWYFAFIFFMVLVNLWLAILKRALYFQKKNITFLLNHFGLWVTLFAGVLGQGDLMRLNMQLKTDAPEWRAVDEHGHVVELPLALELKKFTMDIYPNKLYILNKEGTPQPENNPSSILLDKDSLTHRLLDWKITLHQYIDSAVLVKENEWAKHGMWGSTNAAYVTVENLKTGAKETSWLASGNFQFPPQAIQLDSSYTLVMAPPEARKFESEIVVYEKSKETQRLEKIQVNHPVTVDGWKIYQTSYDEKLGRWSDTSIVELVLDPWLPLVYAGIFILIAGSVAFLIQNRK